MKQEIDIVEFLKTGKFGSVQINDSLEIVIEKLGQPDGEINVSQPYKGIHYGWYELMFKDNKLQSIQNDHFDSEDKDSMEFENKSIKINSKFLKANSIKCFFDIKEILEKENIKHKEIEYWGRPAIETIGKVVLDFNNEFWSDNKGEIVSKTDQKELEFIGIRFYPLQ